MSDPSPSASAVDTEEGRLLLAKATAGPWHLSASWRPGDENHFGELPPDVSVSWQIQGGYPEDPAEGWALLHSEVPKGTIEPEDADLDLILWLRNNADALLSSTDRARGLEALLRQLLEREEDDCRTDHNGFCQSHLSGPCLIAEARAALSSTGDGDKGDGADAQ